MSCAFALRTIGRVDFPSIRSCIKVEAHRLASASASEAVLHFPARFCFLENHFGELSVEDRARLTDADWDVPDSGPCTFGQVVCSLQSKLKLPALTIGCDVL